MSEIQTKRTSASVADYLAAIEDPRRRADCQAVAKLMEQLTKSKPEMWGPSIVGFGEREQLYANGKTATWMKIGFSSRKQNLVLYIMGGKTDFGPLLEKLGKHKRGKGCLYINHLADIDQAVLADVLKLSLQTMENA